MAGMDKVHSLHDAIAADVQNGASIAMGCGLESLIPLPPATKSSAKIDET
jgi:hypothetical protein